jgi:sugar (pentulose or hexulose) kinase
VCAELGAGVVDEGQLYGYLGTASTIAGPIDRPQLDPTRGLIVMPGSRADRWRVLALAMAGGSALEWFGSAFGRPVYAELEGLLAESPPGAHGVQFMPTLAGAGAPFWDAAARGAFLGLSLSTRPADLARAVLEGVALEMRWMLSAIHTFGVAGRSLHLTGGGTRSDGWCQVVANATQVPVVRVPDPELGLRGAAYYALAALGAFPSALDAARVLGVRGDEFAPDARLAERYAEGAELYRLTRESFRDSGLDKRLFATAGVE